MQGSCVNLSGALPNRERRQSDLVHSNMPQTLCLSTEGAASTKKDSHGLVHPPKPDLASHQIKTATLDCEKVA